MQLSLSTTVFNILSNRMKDLIRYVDDTRLEYQKGIERKCQNEQMLLFHFQEMKISENEELRVMDISDNNNNNNDYNDNNMGEICRDVSNTESYEDAVPITSWGSQQDLDPPPTLYCDNEQQRNDQDLLFQLNTNKKELLEVEDKVMLIDTPDILKDVDTNTILRCDSYNSIINIINKKKQDYYRKLNYKLIYESNTSILWCFRSFLGDIILNALPCSIKHYPAQGIIECDIEKLYSFINKEVKPFCTVIVNSTVFLNLLARHGLVLRQGYPVN